MSSGTKWRNTGSPKVYTGSELWGWDQGAAAPLHSWHQVPRQEAHEALHLLRWLLLHCPGILQGAALARRPSRSCPSFYKICLMKCLRTKLLSHRSALCGMSQYWKTHFSGLLKLSNFFLIWKRRSMLSSQFGKCSFIDSELPHPLLWITCEINIGLLVQSVDGNGSVNDGP